MRDVDPKTLFDGAAAVVTTVAVGIFVFNVDLGYSPVSKLLSVVCFLVGIFAITQRTDDRRLTLLGYGVVVVSLVMLFFETVGTFDLGDSVTVLGLLAIAAVLFGARFVLDADDRFVTGRQATRAFVAVALLTGTVLAADVATGGLAYELRLGNEVTVPEGEREQVRAGSLVVTNPTPLPERLDGPRYGVCTAGNWSAYRPSTDQRDERPPIHADLHVETDHEERVMGYSSATYPVELHLEGPGLAGETIPVERTDGCPDVDTGAPYLAVFESSGDEPGVRPV
ncbi:MAG: hypothetical protein ABEJ34_06280 [Haloferacaceae archaeon]